MATDNNYPSVNILSEGSELEGHLNSEHDVRIGGYLSGTVTTKAKLIVSDHGQINGDVKAMQVDIAGKIEGNVFVKQKAVLRTGAVIEGNISAKILVVEEGAVINGLCRMSDDALITPKKGNKVLSKIIPRSYRVYLSLGTEIAISLAAPILIGFGIDSYLNTRPWGLLGGVVLGMLSFLVRMIVLIQKLSKEKNTTGD